MITGEQVTQARELLRWSIVDLAHRSGVPRRAILMFEVEAQLIEEDDAARIKTALERAGIEFTKARNRPCG
jgi:predicted transcriptional regulator